MAKLAITAALLCAAAYSSFAAEPLTSKPDERPNWCQSGYVCLKTPAAADLLIRIEILEEQNAVLKARRARAFGWAAVCGPSASLSVEDGGTTFAGTLSCTVGAGYRF